MCVGVYVFRYAALCLVLVVPEVVSVMRTLWGSTLLVSGSLRHWPPLHVTLLVGIVVVVVAVVVVCCGRL